MSDKHVELIKSTIKGAFPKMNREQFKTRKIRLVGKPQIDLLLSLIPNLPIDAEKPLEVVIREEVKARKQDQNSLYWAGHLKDISEQAYVNGRTYSPEVWHEHLKGLFLPEKFDSLEHREMMVKDGYKKWDMSPSGRRILVGSTTDLTVKGFALYLQQVEAFGANLGVMFGVRESDFS